MVYIGCLPNQQRIILNKETKVIACDEFNVKTGLVAGANETLDSLIIRWRILVVGIDQNGQIIFLFIRFGVPLTGEIFFNRDMEQWPLFLHNFPQRQWLDRSEERRVGKG